jgi:hypothetical protein
MKTKTMVLFITLIFVCVSVSSASIKERFRARLPKIKALKIAGTIGENNKGYVEFRKPDGTYKALIDAENGDRLKVYKAIAKQQKTTLDIVQKRRALQILKKAPAGTWVQKASGQWVQK